MLTRSLTRHLDFAIGEFRDLKMQPSLERALRHRDIPEGLAQARPIRLRRRREASRERA